MLLAEVTPLPTPALKRALLVLQQDLAEEGIELKDIIYKDATKNYEYFVANIFYGRGRAGARRTTTLKPCVYVYLLDGQVYYDLRGIPNTTTTANPTVSKAEAVNMIVDGARDASG